MYSYGRFESPDERDKLFNVDEVIPQGVPLPTKKFWWDNAWWGNQGRTSQCVSYSWCHWIEDGPVIQDRVVGRPKPIIDPTALYNACQKVDRWPGEEPVYKGTSIRAGAKLLKHMGVIREYRWAFNIRSMVKTLLTLGPMVVGTRWYAGMEKPNRKGAMTVNGRQRGGHAYIVNGVDTQHEFFRIKNSWGQRWGDNGHGYIKFDDFEKLLADGGDACIASEVKIARQLTQTDLNEAVDFIQLMS